MDQLKAHAIFAKRWLTNEVECFPHSLEVQAPDGTWLDAWPAGCVAAVVMAGYLDDAKTEDDLLEGLAHFETCVSADIDGFTLKDWEREAGEVANQFLTWALDELEEAVA